MYNMKISRQEYTHDSQNRAVVILTEVAFFNYTKEIAEAFNKVVANDYMNNDGSNIDFDEQVGEDAREMQITGELVLKFIDLYNSSNKQPLKWYEDGIGFAGEPFEVKDKYYTVELF